MRQSASCNQRTRRSLAATILTLAIATLVPISAHAAPVPALQPAVAPMPSGHAGYWAQTSCSEGNETASTEGWVHESLNGYPNLYGAIDTCLAIGGSLSLRDEGARDSDPGSGPMWVYQAPAISMIAGGVVHLTMRSPGGDAYLATPNNQHDPQDLISDCELCGSVVNTTVAVSHSGGWQLFVGAPCTPPSGEGVCSSAGFDAEMDITSATILLHNESTPTGTGFAGGLLDDPASGTANLTFTAHDEKGPGVYRVTIQVDGQVLWSATPNLNENKCVAHGTYDEALNFHNSQPCPQATSVSAEIPTPAIADGQHQLEVEVEDAAGNTSLVYDHTITIENHPATASTALVSPAPATGPANGTPASEQATLSAHWRHTFAKTLRGSYGKAQIVEGRLTNPSGAPIAGAAIDVSETPSSLGARTTAIASVHTSSAGSFKLTVPGDAPSAHIILEYRSHLGNAQPAATQTLALAVAASVHLTVSPHVTSMGRTIVLAGTLAGPIPPGGKLLTLQARSPGTAWIEFHNIATDARGHFRVTHRFKFPGPARYEFRALCSHEADFPFLAGTSNVVHVQEQ
jgi:hypothetical protein